MKSINFIVTSFMYNGKKVLGEIEDGMILDGKLFRFNGHTDDGLPKYEETKFTFLEPVCDGPCKFIGKIIQRQIFEITQGFMGAPEVLYEAKILFEWVRIK